MRILFDTNVVLDVILSRKPHEEEATLLLNRVTAKRIEGLLCATTLTTVDYLVARAVGRSAARKAVSTLLGMFSVAPVDHRVLAAAFLLDFQDYEDAVLHEAADQAGAEGIVTRDPKGFSRGTLRVYDPGELLRIAKVV